MELQPANVPGELFLGGDGLAWGYLNRPGQTAERFVPNPFGESGLRLYRSGDASRISMEGVIEIVGRMDQQVKLRGFRIEPGEIEYALGAVQGVKNALVRVTERGTERFLTAWIQPEGEPLEPAELQSALRGRLPEYMIPSAWVMVDQFPLTLNGKVDVKALPEPDHHDQKAERVPPSTPT